ncbi:MAG TPA: alpha/beta fold hydrolase [Candidatus Methylomirabilis sp.]|nr:alpha/beta fold hydrolase [Candidatus Methylomirabilis sp.]
MQITRVTDVRSQDGHLVPGYLLRPASPAAGVAIAHGYGGCKEQMLGLAVRAAEANLAACVFDLRGHGEHPAELDSGLLEDLEATLRFLRRFGRVAAAGHSLGGRLALMSSADVVVAISPALPQRPSEEGRAMLTRFGSTAVRAQDPGQILNILRAMAPPGPVSRPTLLVHAESDIPSVIEATRAAAAAMPAANLQVISRHQHPSGGLPELPASLLTYLPRWFNHLDLKVNAELYGKVPAWLAAQLEGFTGIDSAGVRV